MIPLIPGILAADNHTLAGISQRPDIRGLDLANIPFNALHGGNYCGFFSWCLHRYMRVGIDMSYIRSCSKRLNGAKSPLTQIILAIQYGRYSTPILSSWETSPFWVRSAREDSVWYT